MNLLECTSPRIAALDRRTPVIFPIAALEQHGPHLPLFTDSLLLGEVVQMNIVHEHSHPRLIKIQLVLFICIHPTDRQALIFE